MFDDVLKENTDNISKLSLTITLISESREVSRQDPARSRLPRQKRVLGEDFPADRVELLGGGHRAAVHQVRGQ